MPAQSRLAQVRPAVRPALKARMMIAAPYGAGKTKTALMLARHLAPGGKVLVIDTEKESALTYADLFVFEHLPWAAPFDAVELKDVFLALSGYEVVIVDSTTHFWTKEGGILEVAHGKFTGWKEARPIQEDLVQAILACPAHVILCVRSKMEYTQKEVNGRQVVERVGMEPQQDADLGYEINVALDMSMDHTITVTKTRCEALPLNRTFRAGEAGVVELARVYGEWLAGGEPLLGRSEAEALIEMFNALTGDEDRKLAKRLFVSTFTRPEFLHASQLDDAERWIKDYLTRGGPPETAAAAPTTQEQTDSRPDTEVRAEASALPVAGSGAESAAPSSVSPPSPATPSDPTQAPAVADPSATTISMSTPEGGSEADTSIDEDAYAVIIESVKALSVVDVTRQLAERGLDQSGNADTKRARLAKAMCEAHATAGSAEPPRDPRNETDEPQTDLAKASAIVEPLSDEEVVVQLTERELSTAGNKTARRFRLVQHYAHEFASDGPTSAPAASNGSAAPVVPDGAVAAPGANVGEAG